MPKGLSVMTAMPQISAAIIGAPIRPNVQTDQRCGGRVAGAVVAGTGGTAVGWVGGGGGGPAGLLGAMGSGPLCKPLRYLANSPAVG